MQKQCKGKQQKVKQKHITSESDSDDSIKTWPMVTEKHQRGRLRNIKSEGSKQAKNPVCGLTQKC